MKMPSTQPTGVFSRFPSTWIPPLENGDRLTREEFERRYEAMPRLKKAELIEGAVHIPGPVRFQLHAEPHASMVGWLGLYHAFTRSILAGDSCTVCLDPNNEPQPDAVAILRSDEAGKAFVDADDFISGSPEWIGEVASSSASIELGIKFRVYERNRVQEYVVWRVLDREIDWFTLKAAKFERLALSREGYLKCLVFPGLWLEPKAMIEGDMARVFHVLQQGLDSPEHQAFVGRLKAQTS